jgi:hypothetical protein
MNSIHGIWRIALSHLEARLTRSVLYFVLAILLLSANTYGIESFWALAFAIAVFGMLGTAAVIGQICLAILGVMAVIPAPALASIAAILS